jgi:hypothetical protein
MRAPARRVQIRPARRDGAKCVHELFVGRLLEDVAARAGLEGLAGERRVLLHRQHHHAGGGRLLEEDGNRGKAGVAGHVEVEDEHVGAVCADVAAGVGHVACLGHDVEAVLTVEEHPQPAAHDTVVIGDHDLGHRGKS